ncbi:MAG: hypothetical protein M0Q91_06830 [Methanoregula sp.]|nr:hypothetical protein [Methanoregula sp.]
MFSDGGFYWDKLVWTPCVVRGRALSLIDGPGTGSVLRPSSIVGTGGNEKSPVLTGWDTWWCGPPLSFD